MRQLIFLFLMLFPLITFSQSSSQQVISKIETLINQYASKNNIPAINVGIIIDDKTYFINYGVVNRVSTNKTSENSIFQIGSLSKLFTGIIINDLIQKGEIGIDKSILTYLPDTYSDNTKTKLKNITIGELLHHQSGFMHQSKVIKRKDGDPIIYDYREADFERDLEKMKIKSRGTYSYSNFGYSILGYIAERITKTTFEDLLEIITKEYVMENTSVSCDDSSSLVTAYKKDKRKIEAKNWKMGKLTPSGGLYSTVSDLTNLLYSQLKVYKVDNKKSKLYLTSSKRTAWSGTNISYGFGIYDWGNGDFGHTGDMDGYASEFWFNPKKNIGFVLLTSSGGKWVSELGRKIGDTLKNIE